MCIYEIYDLQDGDDRYSAAVRVQQTEETRDSPLFLISERCLLAESYLSEREGGRLYESTYQRGSFLVNFAWT